ncbi:MAG: hypothetical protein SGPRY_009472 [Prymnesium sp.]
MSRTTISLISQLEETQCAELVWYDGMRIVALEKVDERQTAKSAEVEGSDYSPGSNAQSLNAITEHKEMVSQLSAAGLRRRVLHATGRNGKTGVREQNEMKGCLESMQGQGWVTARGQ